MQIKLGFHTSIVKCSKNRVGVVPRAALPVSVNAFLRPLRNKLLCLFLYNVHFTSLSEVQFLLAECSITMAS